MANTLEILVDVKNAEGAVSKLDRVERAVADLEGVSDRSSRSLGKIGEAARRAAAEAGELDGVRQLEIEGEAELRELQRRLDEVNDGLEEYDRAAKRASDTSKDSARGVSDLAGAFRNLPIIAQIGAISAAGLAIRQVFEDVARIAGAPLVAVSELEDSLARFNVAMASTQQLTATSGRAIQGFARDLESVTTFSDEAIIGVAALVAQIGRVSGLPLEEATEAALDLAVAAKTELRSASVAVGKALSGNTEEISEYVGKIDPAIQGTERAAEAMRLLREQFGGAARGEVDALSGKASQLANAWQNLLTVLGTPLRGPIVQSLERLTASAEGLVRLFGGSVGNDLTRSAAEQLAQLRREFENSPPDLQPAFLPDFQRSIEDVRADIEGQAIEIRIRAAIDGAPLDEAARLVSQFANQATQAERNGEELAGRIRQLADLARQRYEFRLEANASAIEAAIASVDTLIDRGRDIRAEISVTGGDAVRATLGEVDRLLEERQRRATVTVEGVDVALPFAAGDVPEEITTEVNVQERGVDAILERFRDVSSEEIVANVRTQVEGATPEELQQAVARFQGVLAEVGRVTAAELAAGTARADELVAVLDKLRAAGVEIENIFAGVAEFNVAVQGIDAIDAVTSAIRGLGAADVPELLGEADIARAGTLREQFDLATSAIQDLISAGRDTAAADAFNLLFRALSDIERKFPELADQARAFRAELTTAIEVPLRVVSSEQDVARQIDAVFDAVESLQRARGANAIELLDTANAREQTRDLAEAFRVLETEVTSALESGDERQLTAALASIDAVVENAGESWRNYDAAVVAALANLRAEAQAGIRALEPLFAATATAEAIEIQIKLGNIELALAQLTLLRAQIDGLPEEQQIVLQLRVQQLEQQIKRAERTTEKGASEIAKVLTSALADAPFDIIGAQFSGVLQQMAGETQEQADVMVAIITDMVDEIIKQLLRVLAIKFAKKLLDIITGGATAPIPAPTFDSPPGIQSKPVAGGGLPGGVPGGFSTRDLAPFEIGFPDLLVTPPQIAPVEITIPVQPIEPQIPDVARPRVAIPAPTVDIPDIQPSLIPARVSNPPVGGEFSTAALTAPSPVTTAAPLLVESIARLRRGLESRVTPAPSITPPPVLDFARQAGQLSPVRATPLIEPVETSDAAERFSALLPQGQAGPPINIRINAIDSKDVMRSLRVGELGRAFAGVR